MIKPRQALGRALGASLLLHAALLVVADLALTPSGEKAKDSASAQAPPARLSATLHMPPPPLPDLAPAPPPTLLLPPPAAVAKHQRPADREPPPTATVPTAAAPAVVVRQALAQLAEHLLYPVEAVDQGLEGEVLVMLFLDPSGNVIAARVERGSGHAILDQAAVAAARRLRALPAATSSEILLPVRFRLN